MLPISTDFLISHENENLAFWILIGTKKISEVWRDSRDNLFYNVTMTKTHVYLYEMLRKIDILLHWNLKDTVTSENPFRSRSSTEEKEQFFSELPLI